MRARVATVPNSLPETKFNSIQFTLVICTFFTRWAVSLSLFGGAEREQITHAPVSVSSGIKHLYMC